MKLLFSFIFLSVIFSLTSCVGEIDSSVPKITQTADGATGGAPFPGVFEVNGVAEDKIEVYFDEVTGGSGFYTYVIYLGDSATPEYVDGAGLIKDYRGKFYYTLLELERDQQYAIKVEAIDNDDGTIFPSSAVLSTRTFANEVSSFLGIATASNLAGPDGLDAIRVRFFQALKDNSSIFTFDGEPVAYEITAVDQAQLTPGDMHNPVFGPGQGRFVSEVAFEEGDNEITIRGLPSATDFFVGMRAIHTASIDDISMPNLRSELNTIYREISTLTPGLANIIFDTNSFTVGKAAGQFGSSAVIPSWGPAEGVFDHYRIYFAPDPASPTALLPGLPLDCSTIGAEIPIATGVNCKKLDPAVNTGIITGLMSDTDYNFVLVICETITCGPGERIIANEVSQTTTPNIAAFSGIANIELADDISELGSVFLNYGIPDFSNGFFDGFIVAFNTDANPTIFSEISEAAYVGPLSVANYNYITAGRIEIRGIDYSSVGQYCFALIPFNYDGAGLKTKLYTPSFQCIVPVINPPTNLVFPGLALASTSDYNITVFWSPPPQGMFTHYEIYMKKTAPPFSFSAGISEAFNFPVDNTNYERYFVDRGESNFTIQNIDIGSYDIGILTFFLNGNGQTLRSEFNPGIFRCNVTLAPSGNPCLAL